MMGESYERHSGESAYQRTAKNAKIPDEQKPPARRRVMTSYERTRAAVYATGNKWAIENFEATH